MARVKIVDPKTITDPATLEMFDWVAKAEGEAPNHFLIEVHGLREVGLTDKGVVQLVHVVSDFASCNRIYDTGNRAEPAKLPIPARALMQ